MKDATAPIIAALTLAIGTAVFGVDQYQKARAQEADERAVCQRAGLSLVRTPSALYCVERSGQVWSFETFAGGGR